MPNAPRRPCPRCGGPAPCARCRRRGDRARGSARVRGYDDAWAAYARAWLEHLPYCGQRHDGALHAEHSTCAREGRHVRAAVVDHIVALRRGGSLLDAANHQSLCRSCNARKGRTVDAVGPSRPPSRTDGNGGGGVV